MLCLKFCPLKKVFFFQLKVNFKNSSDRSELVDLFYKHVQPKPQREIFAEKTKKSTNSPRKRPKSPSFDNKEKKLKLDNSKEESTPSSPKKKFKRIEFP